MTASSPQSPGHSWLCTLTTMTMDPKHHLLNRKRSCQQNKLHQDNCIINLTQLNLMLNKRKRKRHISNISIQCSWSPIQCQKNFGAKSLERDKRSLLLTWTFSQIAFRGFGIRSQVPLFTCEPTIFWFRVDACARAFFDSRPTRG